MLAHNFFVKMKIVIGVSLILILSHVAAEDDGTSMECYQHHNTLFTMKLFTGMTSYTQPQMKALTVYDFPPDGIGIFNLRYLILLFPLAVAYGVWNVRNIERECGSLKWTLVGAIVPYPLLYFFNEPIGFLAMVMTSSLLFYSFYKQRCRQSMMSHILGRMAIFRFCTSLFLPLWGSYLLSRYQSTTTDSQGNEIPIYEALYQFLTTTWWFNIKQWLIEIYNFVTLYKVKNQIAQREQNAFKVLGLSRDASQEEITSTWRRLSREFHADKVKDESQRCAAQERFMEIRHAYELLSNTNNKVDNSITDT